MTERSYFWNGTVTGDAALAPYNALEFNAWMFSAFLANNITDGFVVPGYLDDLVVRSAGSSAHSIIVYSGAACVNNYLYVLDTPKSFAITRPSTGMYRKDLVVIRINYNTQQARLAIIEGGENANVFLLTEPVPVRTAAVYDLVLAEVLVQDAYSPTVEDRFVYDKRKFIYNVFANASGDNTASNLVRNSEWLAFSNAGVAAHPDEWVAVTSPAASARVTMTKGSGRGDLGLDPPTYPIEQWIHVTGHTFTVKVVFEPVTTSVQLLIQLSAYRSNGEESSVNKGYYLQKGSVVSEEILFTVTFPEDDIEKLLLHIEGDTGGYISQIIVLPGYHTGGYRAVPETIMFTRAVTDASWTATAKSTGTTTIDFSASFGTWIKNYTRAVILRLRGRDSGSAAAASCFLRALGYAAPFNSVYGHLELSGVTNDVWRETIAIVPVDQIYYATGAGGAQLRLDIVATGAATFDATVEVVGIII